MKRIFNFIFLLLINVVQAQSFPVRTNHQIVDSLTTDLFQITEIQKMNAFKDSVLLDMHELESESGMYLTLLIGNLYSNNSFQVFRNYNEVSTFQGLVVQVTEFKIGITYSKPFERSFLGIDFVKRMINFKIRGQIYRGDNQHVEKAIEKQVLFEDEIGVDSIREVEESPYQLMKGKRQDFTFWEKVSEPVIAIASVAIIVYLFFSQRS